MVICKFYQQGNCRYGQYCQFDHVNRFATNAAKVDSEDDIPIVVAKEVIFAERGGQWLLSCFAPFKDRPGIPGMEDLSPEEVRWEIYQGQKNGTVEQAKLRFQQLCQDMKAKREMLRNPNREVIAILKKLLGSVQKGGLSGSNDTAGKSSSFSFAAPQSGLANNASSNNVFGKQMFGVQINSFGGGFVTSNKTLMFGRAAASMTSMFGGFGNNLNFGSATSTNSFFGGTTSTSSFNGVQNPPAFGSVAAQTNSVFGGAAQGMFGQNGMFGGTGQLGSQSTTAFDSGTTASTSLFNNMVTSQASPSLFSTTQTTTANLFGGSPSTQTNSVFSATTSSGPFTGIFNQSKSLPAFGGAPVFGGVTNYAGKSGTIFGASALTFGTPAISTNNIFGASATTATPVFGALAATTAFSGTATIPAPVFGLCQQPAVNTFGATVSAPNVFGTQNTDTAMSVSGGNTPFGGSAIGTPFVTASSQFGSTSTASASFAGTGFSLTTANTGDTFRPAISSTPLFANAGTSFVSSNATVSNPSPFAAPAFSNLTASPFGVVSTTITSSTSTTTTTTTMSTTVNPFAPRTQQTDTPFGSVAPNQSVTNASSPFTKSPFSTQIIDDTVYTEENLLTDDEKSMYFVDKFVFGKIPLKPPPKDIR